MERSPAPWDGAGPWEPRWRRGVQPLPHPQGLQSPTRVFQEPPLGLTRPWQSAGFVWGAWSLGHPSTPLGDSCLDREAQETGEALFRRAPRGAKWEAPLSCLVVVPLGRGEADP